MSDSLDDFHHNIQRKVKAEDLPIQVSMRIKDETDYGKFLKLKKELKERTGRDGNQKTLEAILELAWMKVQELEDLNSELDTAFSVSKS